MRHRDNKVLEEGHLQNGYCGPDMEGLTSSCSLVLHEAPRGSPSSKRRQRRSALAQDRRAGKGQVGASLQSLSKRDPPHPALLARHQIEERGAQLRVAARPNRLPQAPPQSCPRDAQQPILSGKQEPLHHSDCPQNKTTPVAQNEDAGTSGLPGMSADVTFQSWDPRLQATEIHCGSLSGRERDGRPREVGSEGTGKCPLFILSQDPLPRHGAAAAIDRAPLSRVSPPPALRGPEARLPASRS